MCNHICNCNLFDRITLWTWAIIWHFSTEAYWHELLESSNTQWFIIGTKKCNYYRKVKPFKGREEIMSQKCRSYSIFTYFMQTKYVCTEKFHFFANNRPFWMYCIRHSWLLITTRRFDPRSACKYKYCS